MNLRRMAATAAFGLFGWGVGAVGAAPAFATDCANGATCTPATLTLSPSATLEASASGPIDASGSFNSTFTEQVWANPSNDQCAGCLTWIVKVTNDGGSGATDPIERITISNFAGYAADIGINSSNATPAGGGHITGGTQSPSDVTRSSSGGVIGWDFKSSASEIMVGQSSVLLQADTNATSYAPGLISVQDGGANQANAFQPAGSQANVPDAPWVPGLGLIGGVAAGGFVFRRRLRLPAGAGSAR